MRVLPRGARIVTIEEARENLPKVTRWLAELQAMSDEAHDLTEELEVLLETLQAENEHVECKQGEPEIEARKVRKQLLVKNFMEHLTFLSIYVLT